MELWFCYEDCYHGGQRFYRHNWYPFPDRDLLPRGTDPVTKEKNVIRHFELAVSEVLEKENYLKTSKSVKSLMATITELVKIPEQQKTQQIHAEIRRYEGILSEFKGDRPVDQRRVGPTIVPEIDLEKIRRADITRTKEDKKNARPEISKLEAELEKTKKLLAEAQKKAAETEGDEKAEVKE